MKASEKPVDFFKHFTSFQEQHLRTALARLFAVFEPELNVVELLDTSDGRKEIVEILLHLKIMIRNDENYPSELYDPRVLQIFLN